MSNIQQDKENRWITDRPDSWFMDLQKSLFDMATDVFGDTAESELHDHRIILFAQMLDGLMAGSDLKDKWSAAQAIRVDYAPESPKGFVPVRLFLQSLGSVWANETIEVWYKHAYQHYSGDPPQ